MRWKTLPQTLWGEKKPTLQRECDWLKNPNGQCFIKMNAMLSNISLLALKKALCATCQGQLAHMTVERLSNIKVFTGEHRWGGCPPRFHRVMTERFGSQKNGKVEHWPTIPQPKLNSEQQNCKNSENQENVLILLVLWCVWWPQFVAKTIRTHTYTHVCQWATNRTSANLRVVWKRI